MDVETLFLAFSMTLWRCSSVLNNNVLLLILGHLIESILRLRFTQ